jgi:hypothetical protein
LVRPFTASNYFVGIRTYARGREEFEIHTRSATAWQQDGSVIGHTSVAGAPATVTSSAEDVCVTWTDPDHLIREVCSYGRPDVAPEVLIRVAQSMF